MVAIEFFNVKKYKKYILCNYASTHMFRPTQPATKWLAIEYRAVVKGVKRVVLKRKKETCIGDYTEAVHKERHIKLCTF